MPYDHNYDKVRPRLSSPAGSHIALPRLEEAFSFEPSSKSHSSASQPPFFRNTLKNAHKLSLANILLPPLMLPQIDSAEPPKLSSSKSQKLALPSDLFAPVACKSSSHEHIHHLSCSYGDHHSKKVKLPGVAESNINHRLDPSHTPITKSHSTNALLNIDYYHPHSFPHNLLHDPHYESLLNCHSFHNNLSSHHKSPFHISRTSSPLSNAPSLTSSPENLHHSSSPSPDSEHFYFPSSPSSPQEIRSSTTALPLTTQATKLSSNQPPLTDDKPSSSTQRALPRKRKKKQCPECLKMVSNLVTHKSTHISQESRPHVCNVCQRGFARLNDLVRHTKRHWKDTYNDTHDLAALPESRDGGAASGQARSKPVIFKCPYWDPCAPLVPSSSTVDHEPPFPTSLKSRKHSHQQSHFPLHRCHQTGVFSRGDTFKNHLKAIHFQYPEGTKKKQRPLVPGHCKRCRGKFENVDEWLNGHVLSNECGSVVSHTGLVLDCGGKKESR